VLTRGSAISDEAISVVLVILLVFLTALMIFLYVVLTKH